MVGNGPGSCADLLGRFPFSLSGDDLRARARSELDSADQELQSLLDSGGPKTIENFLVPLNRLLSRVQNAGTHGNVMFNAHPDPDVRKAGREASEGSERFLNSFLANSEAFRILRNLPLSTAEPETRFAVSKMLRDMRRMGAELSSTRRGHVVALSDEIVSVSNQYHENIAKSVRFVEIAGPAELEGMPADFLAAHPPREDGTVRVSVDYPDWFPVHTFCKSPEVRRRIFREALNRAYPENTPVVERLLRLRAELAHELGYPNFAAYAIEDKMLKTPQAVRELLDKSAAFLRPLAEIESARQLERKRRDEPGAARLGSWDVRMMSPGYYEQKIVEETLGGTTAGLRDYLPFGRVRDGLFRLCEDLFSVTITPVPDAEVWHSSVDAYDVRRGSRFVGRFYLDLTPREGKYTHNATFPVRLGLDNVGYPLATLICSFLDPSVPKESARMQHADVVTFFHEFGHLLHDLFSGHGQWLYNTWLYLEWDFIEVPSQLFEEWAREPEVLQRFAENPETHQRPPRELLERIRVADRFGRSGNYLLVLGWSEAALELYEHDPTQMDVSTVLKAAISHYCPIPQEPDYHLECCWPHLPGYSAYFYTYLWSMILARDILQPFESQGSLINPEVARRYMDQVLVPGSSRPASELFHEFMGRDFSFESFERWVRGN